MYIGISYICFIYGDMSYNLFSYFGLSLIAGPCYAEGVSKEMRALKFAVCHAAGHRVIAMLLGPAFWLLNTRGWLTACRTFVSASN